MDACTTPSTSQPPEHLTGAVERVTFHSEESGFCVLRVKVRGHKDLVTVVGTAATITPGEYIEGQGWWVNDRTHGLQFKTHHLRVVPPSTLELTVRLFWKLVWRFGSLVSREIMMLKFDGVSLSHLTPWGYIGGQLSHKARESHK